MYILEWGGDGRGLPPAVCLITFVFGGWGLSIRYEEIATPTHNKTQTMQMTSLASCVCNIKPKYRCAYTSVLVFTMAHCHAVTSSVYLLAKILAR